MHYSTTLFLSTLFLSTTISAQNPAIHKELRRALEPRQVVTSVPSSSNSNSTITSSASNPSSTAGISSSTALADIIALSNNGCTNQCSFFINDLANCAKGTSQASIATCACSSIVLGDIRSCAACISTSVLSTPAAALKVVDDYNSFVGLCTKDGLASIIGTIQVTASTTSIDHSSPTGTAVGSVATNVNGTVVFVNPSSATATAANASTPTAKAVGSGSERNLVSRNVVIGIALVSVGMVGLLI